jgi:hypothetical protein
VVITHLYVAQMFMAPLCRFSPIAIATSLLMKTVSCSHLDHIGALPYFTEVCGYSGPVYMTVSLTLVISANCSCMLSLVHVFTGSLGNRCCIGVIKFQVLLHSG